MISGVQSCGQICSPRPRLIASRIGSEKAVERISSGSGCSSSAAALDEDRDSRRRGCRRPESAGRRRNCAWLSSIAAAHQQRGAERCEQQAPTTAAATAAAARATARRSRRRSCRCCRTGSNCRAWSCGCRRSRRRGRAHRRSPRRRWSDQRARAASAPPARRRCATSQQQRKRERQPPEAGRDRPDVGQAHHPRPERQRDIAEQERGEGERVRVGLVAVRNLRHPSSELACIHGRRAQNGPGTSSDDVTGAYFSRSSNKRERRLGRAAALVELGRDRSGRSPAPRPRR